MKRDKSGSGLQGEIGMVRLPIGKGGGGDWLVSPPDPDVCDVTEIERGCRDDFGPP